MLEFVRRLTGAREKPDPRELLGLLPFAGEAGGEGGGRRWTSILSWRMRRLGGSCGPIFWVCGEGYEAHLLYGEG
ncbi:hypothetical protein [Aeropyrum camini]|uniref:hypothetical protein n=1 Tax=Aeropyrum camini TaxID=229980 RepID=UPI000786BD86|nr:hypothetical protein [Aeropyrum camini]